MNFTVSLTGAKEIDALLKALPRELTHQVLSSAHLAAAKPLVDREKLLAPEGPTGNLVDSIGAVKIPFKRAEVVGEVIVGPRRRSPYRGFHGHMVEFGTRQRTNKSGANRGRMTARPFARPAFRQEQANVQKLIGVSVGKSMLRTMRRYIK
jgi:HK97 gp10 family phage protein